MLHREMLIAGHFIGGVCDQSIGKVQIYSPYDGRLVGTAAEGGIDEALGAVAAASEAFTTYSRSSISKRTELLFNISAAVKARKHELAELLVLEIGKPITAAVGEVLRLATTFDLAAHELERYEPEQLPLDFDKRGADYNCSVERFPVGPILAVVPYNWPYNLAAHKVAPALATGNTVVLKPSDLAPLSTFTLARIIQEAGCPPGVLNAILVPPTIAERVALDKRIKMVSFTGSPGVGWHLKGLLPEKKVTLELGGDASAIVCEDADLDWTIPRIAAGGYGYAGQICISIQHVLVQNSIYDTVKRRLIEATVNCATGDPSLAQTICGPLISSAAADRVVGWVEEAASRGATIIAGGRRDGNIVWPTLVEGVPPGCNLYGEEVFGPVLTLSGFGSFEEAVQRVNSSKFGIQCGVFTNDPKIAEHAYRSLEVGGVIINDFPTLRFDNYPYGGVKRSGFGREGVRYAMSDMTEPKTLVSRKFKF